MALGYLLTEGMVFPYPAGGVLLLRRPLYPTTGAWRYCGFARPGETTIKNGRGFSHDADQAYQYTAVVVLGNGFISELCVPVRVDFDSGGSRATAQLPMFPLNLAATPIAAGKFRLLFEYDSFGQGAYPKDFQAFRGVDPASVDYGTPLVDSVTGLSTVAFAAGRRRYTFTTAAYGDGTTSVFSVRARNAIGATELNTYTSAAKIAQAAAPPAAAPTEVLMRRIG